MATGILSNTVTGVELARLDNLVLDTDTAFYENPIYIGCSALDANENTKVSASTLHQLEFSSTPAR